MFVLKVQLGWGGLVMDIHTIFIHLVPCIFIIPPSKKQQQRIVELRKVQGLAMVQTASLNAERYVVDSALEAQLHAQLPGETHFGVGEAVMIMAKAA